MSYSQSDLDTLDAAIASGAREVEFGAGPDKRKVGFRSLDEMLRTRRLIAADVSPSSVSPRVTFIQHSRD